MPRRLGPLLFQPSTPFNVPVQPLRFRGWVSCLSSGLTSNPLITTAVVNCKARDLSTGNHSALRAARRVRSDTNDEYFESWLRANPLPGSESGLIPQPLTTAPAGFERQPTSASSTLPDSTRHGTGLVEATTSGKLQKASTQVKKKHGNGGNNRNNSSSGSGFHPSDQSSSSVVTHTRTFPVGQLLAVLEPLLACPKVEWEPRRLAWLAYRCAACSCGVAAAAGGDWGAAGGSFGGHNTAETARDSSDSRDNSDSGIPSPSIGQHGSSRRTQPNSAGADAAAAKNSTGRCPFAGGSGDSVSYSSATPSPRLVPAVRVVLPRLAPRPPGVHFGGGGSGGGRASRRGDTGGGEGWEVGDLPCGWGAGADGGGGGNVFLAAYLAELRGAAIQGGQRCRQQQQQQQQQPLLQQSQQHLRTWQDTQPQGWRETYSGKEAAVAAAAAKNESWDDLEVAADPEELQMLAEAEAEAVADAAEEAAEAVLEDRCITSSAPTASAAFAAAATLPCRGTSAPSADPAGADQPASACALRDQDHRLPPPPSPPPLSRPHRCPAVLPVDVGFVLLSADSAALGVWRGGRLVAHKVLSGYTIRHSAGGTQSRHDRRSGGGGGYHSAGAALRRAETARLWQAVAARLAEWGPQLAACKVLVRSGDVRVWAQLYEARRPPPPVAQRDERWEAAGVGLPRPRLRDLLHLQRRLSSGRVEWLGELGGLETGMRQG